MPPLVLVPVDGAGGLFLGVIELVAGELAPARLWIDLKRDGLALLSTIHWSGN
jgi:hypothetical protein